MSPEDLNSAIRDQLRAEHRIQEAAEIGEEVLNRFIQFEYLRNIDSRWQDHLENLESLREAVYLRAYSQKNPLLEYKLEGFQIFDDMLYEIKTAIARKIFRVRIQQAPGKPAAAAHARGGRAGIAQRHGPVRRRRKLGDHGGLSAGFDLVRGKRRWSGGAAAAGAGEADGAQGGAERSLPVRIRKEVQVLSREMKGKGPTSPRACA